MRAPAQTSSRAISPSPKLRRTPPDRVPRHVGIIPDGNRRWARERGLRPAEGYAAGVGPGLCLLRQCQELGVEELTVYGFTQENTHRPKDQVRAFREACVEFVSQASFMGAAIRVFGDTRSPLFPRELLHWSAGVRPRFQPGALRLNLLVNYGWKWDIQTAWNTPARGGQSSRQFIDCIGTAAISRMDLIVRWGGRRRLSGFPPLQSVYADFFVVDALWPDFDPSHWDAALKWYAEQDVTLGG